LLYDIGMGRKPEGRVRAFVVFALLVVALVVALKFANWLPTFIQKDTMRRYPSIEEVRRQLNFRDLYVPSYFPETIKWPPSEILAQGRPYKAVVLEFSRSGGHGVGLTITQAASDKFSADGKIVLSDVREKITYDLDGTDALLEVGTCEKGGQCSRISWEKDGYYFRISIRAAPFDLVRIAHSMHR
jgi:hypothetical protein